MSRYIDADIMRSEWLYESGTFEPNDVLASIDCQPTVDAVPVVRCKECKNLGNNDGYYFCNAIGLAFGDKPNWFCADGERRTE